jgi:hypothetical protein
MQSFSISNFANGLRRDEQSLETFKQELSKDIDGARTWIEVNYETAYTRNENRLGPYFRSLYHVFKLIDSAELKTKKSIATRVLRAPT